MTDLRISVNQLAYRLLYLTFQIQTMVILILCLTIIAKKDLKLKINRYVYRSLGCSKTDYIRNKWITYEILVLSQTNVKGIQVLNGTKGELDTRRASAGIPTAMQIEKFTITPSVPKLF